MVRPELLLVFSFIFGVVQDPTNAKLPTLLRAMVVEVETRFTRKLNLEEKDFKGISGHSTAYLRSRLAEAGIEILDPPVGQEDWDLVKEGVFTECRLSLEIRGEDNILYRGRLSIRPGVHLLSRGQRNRPILWSKQETIVVPDSPLNETEFDPKILIRLIDGLIEELLQEKIGTGPPDATSPRRPGVDSQRTPLPLAEQPSTIE